MEDLDSVKVDPAHHKVEFENNKLRVVRWVVAPGDKTARHSHPASLLVLLTDYDGRVTTADGKSTEVHAKAVVVIGRVAGNVHGTERVEIQATGVVEGDVTAPRLVIAEGAVVNAKAGEAIWREAGTHVVENISQHPMEGLIVEPKEAASPRPAP